ncbi:MAG: ribosome small subunit-dependent GTPase A, partial [Clostridia bacterium]|nr:ribosome small subunit-dependent GTPase A [Clostridia bacterium]
INVGGYDAVKEGCEKCGDKECECDKEADDEVEKEKEDDAKEEKVEEAEEETEEEIAESSDKEGAEEINEIYLKTAFPVYVISDDDESIERLKESFYGNISAFCGNSGVGKSTLLNKIFPNLNLETSSISNKLGRGKHTTRHVELLKVKDGYIADTPGFSSVDIEKSEVIMKDELPECFPEFAEYLGDCKFTTCSHTVDKGCRIIEAVAEGKISKSRHDNYVAMYNEVKNLKEWEING